MSTTLEAPAIGRWPCPLARLRHDVERVIRARMASPTPLAGMRGREPGSPMAGVS